MISVLKEQIFLIRNESLFFCLWMMLAAKKFVLRSIVFFHLISFSIDALWLGECNKPLGISTGSITDSALTASSSHDMIVGPHRARLGRENGGGAWCPRGMVDKNQLEYIEVDLGSPPRLVTGVGTQGRFANNFGVEYTPAYTVEFMRPGTTHFQSFAIPPGSNETLLFVGNTDTFTEIKNEFDLPLLATRVRIRPISVHPRVVCLRFELYGCNYTDGLDHYEIEGRSEKYEVGEGLLFDGSVTTSLSLEADVITGENDGEPKVKRSIQDGASSSDKLNPTNIQLNSNSSQDSRTGREASSNSPDEVEESLSLPVIPPGEIVAPELPLNVTFIFNEIMNLSKIYIYVDPIHPLIAGAHSLLMISLNYGLDSLTWMEPPAIATFPLQGEAQNITIEAEGRSAQILQIYLTVDHAEINIQEIYFQSEDCDCSFKAELTPNPLQVPKSVLFTPLTSRKVLPDKKSEKFVSDDASFRITSGGKSNAKTLAESNQKLAATKSAIKISRDRIERPDLQTPIEKQTQVTSVRAVNTSTTHRAYVGVAIGFSVGVGVLLCVWMYLCVKSSRSKASSPKIFRRSHPDTLDMACLMDGSLTDFGTTTPTNDNFNDISGTCTRSIRVIGPSSDIYNSQLKSECLVKAQEDLQKAPLVFPVTASNDFKAAKLNYNNRSLNFGHSFTKDSNYEIYKKPNFSKTQISIFGKTKKNISGIKTDATFSRHFGEFCHHRPDISFISSDNGRSVFSSWDANVNCPDLSTLTEDTSSHKRLQF